MSIDEWQHYFKHNFFYVCKEYSLYADLALGENPIGRVDYVAKHASKVYLIEEKLEPSQSSTIIWNSIKVLAYRAAYCIDRGKSVDRIGVMVFIPETLFNHQIRNILSVLKIEWVLFKYEEGRWIPSKSSLKVLR